MNLFTSTNKNRRGWPTTELVISSLYIQQNMEGMCRGSPTHSAFVCSLFYQALRELPTSLTLQGCSQQLSFALVLQACSQQLATGSSQRTASLDHLRLSPSGCTQVFLLAFCHGHFLFHLFQYAFIGLGQILLL